MSYEEACCAYRELVFAFAVFLSLAFATGLIAVGTGFVVGTIKRVNRHCEAWEREFQRKIDSDEF